MFGVARAETQIEQTCELDFAKYWGLMTGILGLSSHVPLLLTVFPLQVHKYLYQIHKLWFLIDIISFHYTYCVSFRWPKPQFFGIPSSTSLWIPRWVGLLLYLLYKCRTSNRNLINNDGINKVRLIKIKLIWYRSYRLYRFHKVTSTYCYSVLFMCPILYYKRLCLCVCLSVTLCDNYNLQTSALALI